MINNDCLISVTNDTSGCLIEEGASVRIQVCHPCGIFHKRLHKPNESFSE